MVATTTILAEDRVVLQNISWQFYESLLEHLGENRAVRLTYDRGLLEIMSPSLPHETGKCGIDRLIAVLAEELGLNLKSAGSLTCKREDLSRGGEPDTCYYIQNEPRVRGNEQINLPEDPPPDLVVEVEYSRSAINKLEVYAALGVPEFWRYNGSRLWMYCLVEGVYVERGESPTFAPITVRDIPQFLKEAREIGEIPMVKRFRAWVRAQIDYNLA